MAQLKAGSTVGGKEIADKEYVDIGVASAAAALTSHTENKNNPHNVTATQVNLSPGVIVAYGGNAAPEGWLECNGQAVSRTTYSALFTAIGTTWGSGDGSTTFNIPDLRGEFLRGWDNGRGVDSGRLLGSYQTGEISAHWHLNGAAHQTNDSNGVAWTPYGRTSIGKSSRTAGLSSSSFEQYTGHTSTVGGSETRPRNKAVMYIIKY